MKNLLFLGFFLFGLNVFGQTVLTGKVKDFDTGEDLIGATVKIFKSGSTQLVKGGVSNYDGEYRLKIEPGKYDIEAFYSGYLNLKIKSVEVLPGRINFQDIKLETGQTPGCTMVFLCPTIPLIQKDKTSGGQTFDAHQLRTWFR